MALTGATRNITPHLLEARRDVIRAIFARPRLRQVVFRYADWRDSRRARSVEFASAPLPPASLRFRVHGDLDPDSFLETGRQCGDDIRAALATLGRDLGSFEHVLDFGCGCGRSLLWFRDAARVTRFSGTDIDAAAIDWCRRHIDFADFQTTGLTPPAPYPD